MGLVFYFKNPNKISVSTDEEDWEIPEPSQPQEDDEEFEDDEVVEENEYNSLLG